MLKIQKLKNFLKGHAVVIRATRKELKTYQREHLGCDGGYFNTLWKLSKEYRYHHIAYSMLRGKTYDAIETNNTKNLPDMDKIKEIKDAYTENVCASAS